MSKRLFLSFIPVLLIATACNGALKKSEEKSNIFLEDTLAHEELFDGERILQPKRAIGDVENPAPDSDAAIGVQSIVQDGKVSFRFVAAITFDSTEIVPTKAVWTRTISKPNGDAYSNATTSFDTGTYECEKVYESLSSDGEPYTVGQYNAVKGTSFTHFVVYTVRNIPLDAGYNDYYVSAYLTLSDKDSEDGKEGLGQVTKAIAINVGRTQKITYTATDGAYFLNGRIGGANNQFIRATSVRSGNNVAAFEYVDFAEGDSFVLNEFFGTKLYIKKSNMLSYDDNSNILRCFEASGDNINLKAGMAGSYGLYVEDNNGFRLKTEGGAPYNVGTGLYFKGSQNNWEEDADYELMHIRNEDGNYGILTNITFAVGDKCKVWRKSDNYWFGWNSYTGTNFKGDYDGSDIECKTAGTYSIYFKNDCVYIG